MIVRQSMTLALADPLTGDSFDVPINAHYDFDANAKFLSMYFPEHPRGAEAVRELMLGNTVQNALDAADEVEIQSRREGDAHASSRELRFAGRVFLYCDCSIDRSDFDQLRTLAAQRGLALWLRDKEYAAGRRKWERPLAFISHDFRDKGTVARPIALGLTKLACPVWFDEFSLKVGDRLRESIEKGLKECAKCVLVLSPSFFDNKGWTRTEFNSIFAREIVEQRDFLLPVWYGVTKQQVFDYSPSLVDRLGVNWDLGEDEVVARLRRSLLS
ncbi:MAG TPA: toll/interleukin-1 receptor domain-containing protein [Anaeromyxobacteraceae bacterium]|nr:toll/interleukin-1 receptor domain-containing protein [Anaeromyxobacteraceae bacterium]